MTFEQWAAFYRIVQAERLEHLAAQVSIVHAGNPRRARDQFLKSAREMLAPPERRPLLADPDRLRAVLRQMPGVGVTRAKPEESS